MRATKVRVGSWIVPVVLAVAPSVACGPGDDREAPVVDRVALQRDITNRLSEAGVTPKSVTCLEDLVGEVGRVAHCDVEVGEDDGFQPVATVTRLNDGTLDYVLQPALSQAQVERAVARLEAEKGSHADAVACESGLEGTVGAVVHCDVDSAGVRARRTVVVTDVSGLVMNFELRAN